MYYAAINATNFDGAVKVTFKNSDSVYATLVLAKNERAFAPSELCGSFSWYNGETLYDFSQQVEVDITLTASWSSSEHGHSWSTDKIIPKADATCTTAGTLAHWHCELCNKNYDADKSTLLSSITIQPLDHTYGEYHPKVNPTCCDTGYAAHYECSVCHALFDENKVETTSAELVIAIDPDGHILGEWQVGIVANCATKGELAHRDCTICNKHFDSSGAEIVDLTIARNADHISQTDWAHDANGHWHVCTREGCKDNGKFDYTVHTRSTEQATELINVHCTVCGQVIENVKPHVHNLQLVSGKDKTCVNNGVKSYYICSNGENPCGKYFEDANGAIEITSNIYTWVVIPAGHKFGTWIDEDPATPEKTGTVAHKDCDNCHKHFDINGNEIAEEDYVIAKIQGYNLIFKIDGEEVAKHYLAQGSAVTYPEDGSKQGFTFAWSQTMQTMPASDVTIEGIFSIDGNYFKSKVDAVENASTVEDIYGAIVSANTALALYDGMDAQSIADEITRLNTLINRYKQTAETAENDVKNAVNVVSAVFCALVQAAIVALTTVIVKRRIF